MVRTLGIVLFVCALSVAPGLQAQRAFGGEPYGLRASHVGIPAAPEVELPMVNTAALEAEDAANAAMGKKGRYRFGYTHQTSIAMEDQGIWHTMGNGDRMWRVRLHCPDAIGIGVIFSRYIVPSGAHVFLYNEAGERLGGFTEASNPGHAKLGVQPMRGERITIEYVEPAARAGQGELTIGEVTHLYRAPWAGFDRGLGDSGPCNINTICPEGDDWRPEIRSVALVLAGGGSCTGQLLNDCNNDSIPYFLTANHCLEGGDPTTWVFRFNWESPTCDPTADGPTDHTVSGATLLVNSAGSDVLFLQLNSQPPPEFDAYYNGWDKSGTFPVSTTCIHHPSGDIKKITHDMDAPGQMNIDVGNGPADCWHCFNYESGTTEPGSSGSGLWDENHRIVGQLYGGAANCANNVDDYYGRFDVSYPLLSQWLGTCGDTLNGLDPGFTEPTIANNAAVTSISGVPASVCNAGEVEPMITLKNNGTAHLHQVTITYTITGGASGNMPWTGNLAPQQTANVQLPAIAVGNGPQELIVATSVPNGSIDGDPSDDNDTLDFVANTPGEPVTLFLSPDEYGVDITWELANAQNTLLYSGGPYTSGDTTTIVRTFCLGDGCYTFTIADVFGDGICCLNGNGHYSITSAFGTHVQGNGQYGYGETRDFCLQGIGMEEFFSDADMRVWPDPASTLVNVEWTTPLAEDLPWCLTDMSGRVALNGQWSAGQQHGEIHTLGVAGGTYLLITSIERIQGAQRIVLAP